MVITLAFIVILDANSLRRQVGKQAAAINHLALSLKPHEVLRERIGHTRVEIAAGIILGMGVAAVIWVLLG